MIFFLSGIVGGFVVGYARGGSLRNLGHTRIRAPWLLYVAVAVQLLANIPRDPDSWVALVLLVASFAMVAGFAAANWGFVGMPVVAAGALLNFIVIVANNGMPVSADALREIGVSTGIELRGKHFVDFGTSRLRVLSDWLVWPLGIKTAISIGDILIVVGLGLVLQDLMARKAPARAES